MFEIKEPINPVYIYKEASQIEIHVTEDGTQKKYAWGITLRDYEKMETFEEIQHFFAQKIYCSVCIFDKDKKSMLLFLNLIGDRSVVPGVIFEFEKQFYVVIGEPPLDNVTILRKGYKRVANLYNYLRAYADALFGV